MLMTQKRSKIVFRLNKFAERVGTYRKISLDLFSKNLCMLSKFHRKKVVAEVSDPENQSLKSSAFMFY